LIGSEEIIFVLSKDGRQKQNQEGQKEHTSAWIRSGTFFRKTMGKRIELSPLAGKASAPHGQGEARRGG
jgi:hypothetical protein